MSLTGASGGVAIKGLSEHERRTVMYVVGYPNLHASLHPDYVMTHIMTPLAVDRTHVECAWAFPREVAERPGFDPSYAVDFWDLTNRQDWEVCELQQEGTRSRAYTAGRFTTMEGGVHNFDAKVADRYANDGIVTPLEEIQKADAGDNLAGRKRAAMPAD